MKRRDFLKKSAAVVGMASAPELLPPLEASESAPQKPSKPSVKTGAAPEENRSPEYLRRVQADKFLLQPPAFAESKLTPSVRISPMALAERLKRNVVPRKGFCSITPGKTVSEGL